LVPDAAPGERGLMSAEVSTPIAEQILRAAVGLFARKGYEATSTREIVEAAGVTKPMLYYYFKNKEGLCEAVLTRFFSQFHSRLQEAIDKPLAPRDCLVELVWAHLDYCRLHRDFAKFFFAIFFGPDESTLGASFLDATQEQQRLVALACRSVVAAGLIEPGREEALVMALNGMINIWVIATIKGEVRLSREVAEQIVDVLLDGLARRQGSPENASRAD
jgi:AcrR family transcriptional regulator